MVSGIISRDIIARRCPQCNASSEYAVELSYSDQQWHVKQCSCCKFVYLDSFPAFEELAEEYSWERTSSLHTEKKKQKNPVLSWLSRATRWRLKIFKRKIASYFKYISPGNIVDIGCGRGGYLAGLSKDYTPFGIEIASAEAHIANDRVAGRGGKVINMPALEGAREFSDNFASGIVMHAFLEHEPFPLQVLEEAYRILLPDGALIIKVPNYNSINRLVLGGKWSGFRLPEHLNYFTPNSLVKMCDKAGFDVRKFSLMNRLPFSDNMWLILKKKRS